MRWWLVLVLGACSIRASYGVGASGPSSTACTACSSGIQGPTFSIDSSLDVKVVDHLHAGLMTNWTFRNWHRASSAYRAITDWAESGATTCCGGFNFLTTVGKYMAVGMGYMTAWTFATNILLMGPSLTWRQFETEPGLYATAGAGLGVYLDEKASFDAASAGFDVGIGYELKPHAAIEARVLDDPYYAHWIAFSVAFTMFLY